MLKSLDPGFRDLARNLIRLNKLFNFLEVKFPHLRNWSDNSYITSGLSLRFVVRIRYDKLYSGSAEPKGFSHAYTHAGI